MYLAHSVEDSVAHSMRYASASCLPFSKVHQAALPVQLLQMHQTLCLEMLSPSARTWLSLQPNDAEPEFVLMTVTSSVCCLFFLVNVQMEFLFLMMKGHAMLSLPVMLKF